MKTVARFKPTCTGPLARTLPSGESAMVRRPAPTQWPGTLPPSKSSLQGSSPKTRTRALASKPPAFATTLPACRTVDASPVKTPVASTVPVRPFKEKVAGGSLHAKALGVEAAHFERDLLAGSSLASRPGRGRSRPEAPRPRLLPQARASSSRARPRRGPCTRPPCRRGSRGSSRSGDTAFRRPEPPTPRLPRDGPRAS
jgi:hypothetical protein